MPKAKDAILNAVPLHSLRGRRSNLAAEEFRWNSKIQLLMTKVSFLAQYSLSRRIMGWYATVGWQFYDV